MYLLSNFISTNHVDYNIAESELRGILKELHDSAIT